MPRIESIYIWRFIHISFTMNDYGEIRDVATGWSRDQSRLRCAAKHDKRYEDAT